MSLTLDLKPEEETTLRSYAAAEGVTPDRFVVRLLKGYRPASAPEAISEITPVDDAPEWKVRLQVSQKRVEQARRASGISEAEIEAGSEAAVKAHRKERAAQEPTL